MEVGVKPVGFEDLRRNIKATSNNVERLDKQLQNLGKTFDSMTTRLIKEAGALQKQAAAAKQSVAAGKQQYTTQNQLIKQQKIIESIFVNQSAVANKKYLTSVSGLRQALAGFNEESKRTVIQQNGQL